LLLQEALELRFSPELLIRCKDAISNSVSNVLTAQASNISTAILERIEDTVSNGVLDFLSARPNEALTERWSGKQYYTDDDDKLAHRTTPFPGGAEGFIHAMNLWTRISTRELRVTH
jgi:hypothetical protein